MLSLKYIGPVMEGKAIHILCQCHVDWSDITLANYSVVLPTKQSPFGMQQQENVFDDGKVIHWWSTVVKLHVEDLKQWYQEVMMAVSSSGIADQKKLFKTFKTNTKWQVFASVMLVTWCILVVWIMKSRYRSRIWKNESLWWFIDNAWQVWDIRKKAVAYTLSGHLDTITGIALSPDGSSLLSNSMDNTGTYANKRTLAFYANWILL